MIEHQLLGYHSAHRYAEDVRTVDVDRFEKRRCVVSQRLHRERLVGQLAQADAAVVHADDSEAVAKTGQKRLSPRRCLAAETPKHQKRWSIAFHVIFDLDLAALS